MARTKARILALALLLIPVFVQAQDIDKGDVYANKVYALDSLTVGDSNNTDVCIGFDIDWIPCVADHGRVVLHDCCRQFYRRQDRRGDRPPWRRHEQGEIARNLRAVRLDFDRRRGGRFGPVAAGQALDAWTKYNAMSSDNANQAAARDLQEKLGMTGLGNEMTLGKGDQAIRLMATLMGNNQAANNLGYQYTALDAAQRQAMMNAILGR